MLQMRTTWLHWILGTLSIILILLVIIIVPRNVPALTRGVGTTYYIDPVKGNDNNSGTAMSVHGTNGPWKTLSKINKTIFRPGDRILLKAGSSFKGQLYPKGSGTSSNPIIVDKYGTGSKPLIDAGGKYRGAIYLKNQQFWEISNLEVTNWSSKTDTENLNGIYITADDGSTYRHIYIKKVRVHDVRGTGILFIIDSGSSASVFSDIRAEDSVVIKAMQRGIMMRTEFRNRNGVTEGIGAWTPMLHPIVRNNYTERTARNGIVVMGSTNALIEHNEVNRAGDGDNGQGIFTAGSDDAKIQYNEVYGTVYDGAEPDAGGIGLDIDENRAVAQYNYIHDCGKGGIVILADGDRINRDAIVRYNITENNGTPELRVEGPVENATLYNNDFTSKPGNSQMVRYDDWNGTPISLHYYNNIFLHQGTGSYRLTGTNDFDYNTFTGNHAKGEPSDPHKMTSNPLYLQEPSASGKDLGTEGYKLQMGSPALKTGKLIKGNGGRDFWGIAVSAKVVPNRGAYNGVGV